MKNFIIISCILLVFISCKKEQKQDDSKVIKGEFILIEDAAVLKGENFIYGVIVDELTLELAKKVKPLKREEFDMVPVEIKGIITPNPKEGWDELVEIKEIIGVSAPTAAPTPKVKAGNDNDSAEVKENTQN